jgi:hypothetical protein
VSRRGRGWARPPPAASDRGTERRRGSSQFYPSCEACRKALAGMRGEDANRAECIAASVESYR